MIEDQEPLGWGITANVVPEGIRHFAAGAKVWLCLGVWGDGGERIRVTGFHRHSRGSRRVTIVVAGKMLENFRARPIYTPGLLEHCDFGKERAEQYARWLTEIAFPQVDSGR